MNENQKLIKKLEDGIELHNRALHDLQVAHSKAQEALQAYRQERFREAFEAQRPHDIGLPETQYSAKQAGIVILGEDEQERLLNGRKRQLAGEIDRIQGKITMFKQTLEHVRGLLEE